MIERLYTRRSFTLQKGGKSMETLTHGITKSASSLALSERKQMLNLMTLYYDGVTERQFNKDLDEKEAVMMMLDSKTLEIVGFSTFMILDLKVGDGMMKGFFSGDTVVHTDYRKTTTMGVELGKNFLATVKRFSENQVYWILISKGCRTYRLLPIFFREWYPRYNCETPEFAKNLMDAFGKVKYPPNYNQDTGLITFHAAAEALKPGVADAHDGRLNDPHIRYFVERNPGHVKGDELVCVANVSINNFAPAFIRMLKQAGVKLDV